MERTKAGRHDSLTARIVTAINWGIAFLLVVALVLVYWFAWRPLPQRAGTLDAPVSAPVSVSFDALGEPHIRASNEEDALIVQGYVTAQDRLWQMDAIRRAAAGDLAEIVGAVGLESDREVRRMGLRRAAEAGYLHLPPRDRAALAAYALGVNSFISTHLNKLPLEFNLLRYQPRPWSAVDCLLVGLEMFRTLNTTWRDKLRKREMLKRGDPSKVEFLFANRTGAETRPGSNAWAVAGSRTLSGKPLLSNDMHLDYSLPGTWYMTHLEAPGLDVAGVALPGTPGIMVGHNQRIAWGFTNLGFDVQDLYVEKLDERTGRYVYRGQMEQARPEIELIRIKGRPTAEMLVWVTRHGPLFLTEGGDHMVLRWTVSDPSMLEFPVLEYDKAQNWQQFLAAFSRFPGPSQNVVYADADGNIGYHAVGKLPVRRGYRGDLPVDGSSGDSEWDGYIPFDKLPSAFNPERGMIVSANQDPFPPDYPYPVNGEFAAAPRSREILRLLSAHTGWQAGQMLSVQTDVYSDWLRFLASQVATAYNRRGSHTPALDRAVDLLRSWNGQMDAKLAAPLLVSLIYERVRLAVGDSASPGSGAAYQTSMSPGAIEALLRERPAGWFHDYDQMLVRALSEGLEEGSRIQGSDPTRWQYGAFLRLEIDHPVIHQVPFVGKYFDIGPVPGSGSGTSIKQTTRTLGPSMRMTADTGDWNHSLLNELTGQSGQILSSHYRDQWPDYYAGRSYPMQFGHVDAKSTLEFRPIPDSKQ
ncbi:MAG: penicillin acylase family protein [Acidobacteriia bacterium]|nr:penicillin acylase family protein [Terriglobia bacterium]